MGAGICLTGPFQCELAESRSTSMSCVTLIRSSSVEPVMGCNSLSKLDDKPYVDLVEGLVNALDGYCKASSTTMFPLLLSSLDDAFPLPFRVLMLVRPVDTAFLSVKSALKAEIEATITATHASSSSQSSTQVVFTWPPMAEIRIREQIIMKTETHMIPLIVSLRRRLI